MKKGWEHTQQNKQQRTGQYIQRIASIQNASMRFFLGFTNSNTAGRRFKQRVGRFTASCLRKGLWLFDDGYTHSTHKAAVNTYEQEISKNCSNAVGR